VWLVEGGCGEYSDRRSWTVAAYLEKAQANACCDRLNKWCKDNKCDRDYPPDWSDMEWDQQQAFRPPEDPRFKADYTGTRYSVYEVPLRVEEGS
jgi:hypothetical protein